MRHAPVRPQIYPPKRHSKRSVDVMLQQDQALERCSQRCSQGDDVLLLDTLPDKPRQLVDQHPYHSLVSELARIGLKTWEEEKGLVADLERSRNSPSVQNQFTLSFRPRKRARRGRQLEDHSASHSDGSCTVETESSDSDTMVVVQHRTRANVSHLLACPFYRLEPARFHSCLWELEIHDMRTLKQHLIVDHHLPDYCPICYETFDSAASRDTHIVARLCSSREAPAGMMRGVSEDQVEKLSKSYVERDRMSRDVSRRRSRLRQRRTIISEEQEWRSVWDILFLTEPQPHSIYLSERHERKAVSLREFWHKVGPAMIANILEERGMRRWEDGNEESDLEALFGSVLASMMESLS